MSHRSGRFGTVIAALACLQQAVKGTRTGTSKAGKPRNGGYETPSKSLYGRTRQEAASRLAAVIRDHDKGLPIVRDERQTVGQYLHDWIEGIRPQIEPSSRRRYNDCIRLHLIPELGRIKLASLSAQHIQAMYARKMVQGLSGTTVRNLLHNTLHRALEDAERMGLVQRNISKHVRAPKRSTQEMHPLTEKQSERFLEAAKGDRFYALYVLGLTTGMREGELLALHWQDIDFAKGTLRVRLGVQEDRTNGHRGRFILDEPKTDYS